MGKIAVQLILHGESETSQQLSEIVAQKLNEIATTVAEIVLVCTYAWNSSLGNVQFK